MPKISEILFSKFPYQPTRGQAYAFKLFDTFVEKKDIERQCVLIKGYAGTGKTTIISTLTDILPLFNLKYILMAPTGRAAKVMNSYSGKPSYTIHKIIYKKTVDKDSGETTFKRAKNYSKDTVFIVDEASMLSDQSGMFGQNLIRDLIDFIFSNNTNKLLLIGDSAQLPPVGSSNSPGLDIDYLSMHHGLQIQEVELTEVMRQEQNSGILDNATHLRSIIPQENPEIGFQTKKYKDIYRINAEKMEDGIRYAYDKYGIENCTIICRSNWQAVQYNMLIRRNILYFDEELEAGDILMVVKNNYHYLEEDSEAGFIANGDFVEVKKIVDFEEKYGFRFATLMVKLVDYPDIPAFDVKIIMDTLYSKTPSLTSQEQKKLYDAISEEINRSGNRKSYKSLLKTNEYLNALQVKFAYALTCHKSQGGQWNIVFVDQGQRGDFEIDQDYVRWLYTALTRAKNELYLINFEGKFFKN